MHRARIATLVRERRELLGKTQSECSEAIGKTKGTWWHIEHETISSSIDTLVDVARVLDAHWDVRLVAGREEARSPERQALLDLIDRLVDRLEEKDVKVLLGQLQIYEEHAKSKAT